MSSAVFFKFRSSKEPQRVTFDGTGISVFELKRDIIRISGLGDGTDFDLLVYNADSNEGEFTHDSQKSISPNFGVEYDDDTTVLSRGTTVVARRMPALKPGAGRAARYVSGKMPVNAKNQHRIEASKTASAGTSSHPVGAANLSTNASEDDKIAAMFNQGGQQWQEQQAQMANQKAIHRTGYVKPNQAVPDKPLPAGYTCHRCGERGHWIQACPTNNDPTFDNRPKFKKTTGIPKSFLKTVDKPPALSSDGTVDMSQLPAGVMYTAEGEWVVAMPDSAAWEQYQAKAKASAEKAQSSEANATLQEWGLECPIDKRMFVDPVKTPCCSKTFCRNCIETALFDSDFVCPSCETSGVLVDDLVEDDETNKKIKEFVESEAKEKDKAAKEQSDEKPDEAKDQANPASPAAESAKVATPSGDNKDAVAESSEKGSPKPIIEEAVGTPGSTTTSVNGSKKRAASDELENKRIPTAPKAMLAEQQTSKTQQEQLNEMAEMAASMGFPGMDPMMMATMFSGMGGLPNMNMNMNMGFPMMNNMNMGMGFNNGAANMGFNNNMNFNNQNMGFGMQNQFQQGMMPQQHGQGNMNGGGHGAYARQPVNPGRAQNRNRNQQQRSVDYRELGS